MWRIFKEGDVEVLSLVYKDYGSVYGKKMGGYYVTSYLEPGDLYIPLYALGEPKVTEDKK